MSKSFHQQFGGSLLELMTVVFIVAIMARMTMPLLQEQIAKREIETIARRFVAHAQFARNQALHLGAPILMSPRIENDWDGGWLVRGACVGRVKQSDCNGRNWFSQEEIYPIYFKGGGKGFRDPHSNQKGILFNAAGAAKSGQGGFVANRLILGHLKMPHLERQLIMGSGGRWRICDPRTDSKACK